MNREKMLNNLLDMKKWGEWEGIHDWYLLDDQYVHHVHDPITLDNWNRAKIVPNINARVLAEKVGAADVLTAGAKHLNDRASTYDSADGERSMGATVEAFESITGRSLTEEQGWLFMVLLKAVRSQQGKYKLDNYEDGAAYFALMAESASEARK